jgi:hypothetical protein
MQRAICRGIFAPAQPDFLAASVRDFLSGAYTLARGEPGMTAPMAHSQMMHGGKSSSVPKQPGQAAFAAIQEIVEILEADPKTDWAKVNIDALRQHLIDMSNVTLFANAGGEPISDGMRFTVTGNTDLVVASIRRMTTAHAATMNGVGDWQFTAAQIDGGAVVEVRVPLTDMAKLKGLGFIVVMTRGMHHQEHHLMIARGQHPH